MKIRPSSRHIFAIGRDLINDRRSAIIELVKNAYDADSEIVNVRISSFKEKEDQKYDNIIKIEISDNGHGMTSDIIRDKWMVPSTDDKLKRKYSPKKRLMQGRKGLGRYASAILGNRLVLETVSDKKKSKVAIDWDEFEKYNYLDEIEFESQEDSTSESDGTKLLITGKDEFFSAWTEDMVSKLHKDLRKLINPFKEKEDFKIFLEFGDFFLKKYSNQKYEIDPISVLEASLYNLKGVIDEVDIEKFIEDKDEIPPLLLKSLKLKVQNSNSTTFMFKGTYENSWSKQTITETFIYRY